VIREDSLRDEEVEGCKNVELAKDAIVYLERLFNAYKNRGTQRLEEAGMDRIFATKEEGIPWRVRMETVYDSGVTFDGWLALWQKYLSHRPREAYESLLYIGYCGKMRDAVTVYPYKLTDALKQAKRRRVFNIYLIGLHGTEAIMGAFVRNQGEARDFVGPRPSVVNYLSEVGKYLIVSVILSHVFSSLSTLSMTWTPYLGIIRPYRGATCWSSYMMRTGTQSSTCKSAKKSSLH
jgi:hypothetical protein